MVFLKNLLLLQFSLIDAISGDESRLQELFVLRLMHCDMLQVRKHTLLLVYPSKWKK